MSIWKIKIFNESDHILKEKIIKAESRYAAKKMARVMVNNMDFAYSFSFIEVNSEKKDE